MTPFRRLTCVACALLASMLPFAAHAQGKIEKIQDLIKRKPD